MAGATAARAKSLGTTCSIPGVLVLLFVMFERCVQTAYYFSSRFEERLRFWLGYLVNVAAQMIDQLAEFFPNVRRMRPRIF